MFNVQQLQNLKTWTYMNFKKCKTSTLGTHAWTNLLIFRYVHVLIID